MQKITVNALFTDLIPLPAVETDAVLTLTIRKASSGTLAGGTFTYLGGIQWKLTFTPATLNEVYGVEVTDAGGDVVFSQSYKAVGVVWDVESGPTGVITVGTNSWITADEAEEYFATRFGLGTDWSGLTDTEKIAAIVSAYKYLLNSGLYTFPTTVSEFTQNMKDAQCEIAIFLIKHQADMDARQGLQAQGVVQAGIVKETYDLSRTGQLAVPPAVAQLLDGYSTLSPMGAVTLERDEDEDVI